MSKRRPRATINRRYLMADVLLKAGGACLWLIALVAVGTPFTLLDALDQGLFQYLAVMIGFGALAVSLIIAGRRLRRTATHWDND